MTRPSREGFYMVQNAYAEGLKAGAVRQASTADCPYRTTLVEQERADWMRGFAVSRQDRGRSIRC